MIYSKLINCDSTYFLQGFEKRRLWMTYWKGAACWRGAPITSIVQLASLPRRAPRSSPLLAYARGTQLVREVAMPSRRKR